MNELVVFRIEIDPNVEIGNTELRIRWLNDKHVWAKFPVLSQDYEEKWLKRRLDAGGQLLVAETEDDIIAWVFFQKDDVEQSDWITVRLPSDSVMSLGAYVIPEFRGKKVLAELKRFAGKHFYGEGVRKIYSMCEPTNYSSMRAQKNSGAMQIKRIKRFALFNLQIIRIGRRWTLRSSTSTERMVLKIE